MDRNLIINPVLHKSQKCVSLRFRSSRPLADSEKLPVRSHRAAEALKSPAEDGDAESAASQEPKKKSSKEKREKKKDKDRDRKVRVKVVFLLETRLTSFCLTAVWMYIYGAV